MLWIPEGFGHGFLVLSEVAGFAYKVTDYYSPAAERTIVWNDPDLAIPWPVAAAGRDCLGEGSPGRIAAGCRGIPVGGICEIRWPPDG